jgi:hypothetical protein
MTYATRTHRRVAVRPRPFWAGGVLLSAAILLTPAAALAERATSTQQVTARAEFLLRTPAAPSGDAAVCIVDSGVTPNADLNGALLGSETINADGDTSDSNGHGTYMAMIAGARLNGWGTVGAWPAIGIYTVRGTRPGTATYGVGDISVAVGRCIAAADERQLPIKAISISLAAPAGVSAGDINTIAAARQNGIAVVVAAGNIPGPVQSPGNAPGAFTVAAASASGGLCSFASSGPEVDVRALGCDVQLADRFTGTPTLGDGSSLSTPFVAAALTALRAYRPDLSVDQAEALLRDHASGGMLDVTASFRAAGLGHIVDAYQPVADLPPSSPPPVPPVGPSPDPAPPGQDVTPDDEPSAAERAIARCKQLKATAKRWCALPDVAISERLDRRRLRIVVENVPRGARLAVYNGSKRLTRTKGRRVTLRVTARGYKALRLRFETRSRKSLMLTVTRRDLES